jgi:hypothetical protein
VTCYGINKAYQHPEVCIGWYPFVTTSETEIRTAPNGGHLLKAMIKGGGVGVQSVRNPRAEATPPPRPAVNGWLWCYARSTGDTGWIRADDVVADPDADTKPALRGPGLWDFEVGRPAPDGRVGPRPKKPNGCGYLSAMTPLRRVAARTVALRYSGRGTAFHYLHEGDLVRLLIVNAPAGYAFCEVVETKNGVPYKGARGWLGQSHLVAP